MNQDMDMAGKRGNNCMITNAFKRSLLASTLFVSAVTLA